MTLYTYGGSPADVLTTTTGDVVVDYPISVRRAGTGEIVTALYEADGVTPISQLRSNPASSSQPGAVRTFKISDVTAIEYEYLDAGGQPVRWYQTAREVPAEALAGSRAALQTTGGTMTGPTQYAGAAAGVVDAARVTGEDDDRYRRLATGEQQYGPGTGARDVRWYRSGAREMTLTGRLVAEDGVDTPGRFTVSGAAGDGVTDDTAAIQAAFDAAYEAGGGTVVIPPGVYAITTFLVLRDHTTVIAYGATIKSISTNQGVLRNFIQGPDFAESFAGYGGHSNIRIFGGVWDGNAADGAGGGTVTAMTNVANFAHCQNIHIQDAVFRNCSSSHLLELNAVYHAWVRNCAFEGYRDNTGNGSRSYAEAIELDIATSETSSIGLNDNTPARDIHIEGCYFGPSDRLGPPGRAIGSHSARTGVTYDDIHIIGCTIDAGAHQGIYGFAWRRAVISGNVIRGSAMSGIALTLPDPVATGYTSALEQISITGNIVEGAASDSGIRVISYPSVPSRGVLIEGNTVTDCGGSGIEVDYGSAPVIANNVVNTTNGPGLYANYCTNPAISGNTVRNAASNAINATGSPGAVISGNVVDTTGSNYAVYLGRAADGATDSTDATISGNNLIAAASAGIRLSTGSARCLVTGNVVRKGSGTTTGGISLASTSPGCTITNNDLSGNGWSTAAALSVSTSAPITGPGGSTSLPGSNTVSQLGTPTLATAANTASQTAVASATIPAGDAVAGTCYRFTVHGTASTTGTPTLALDVALGGTQLAAVRAAAATASALASAGWEMDVLLYCVTSGTTATWTGRAVLHSRLTNGAGGAVVQDLGLINATVTKDSTVAQALTVRATWGTASASNTISATAASLQRVS